MTLRRFLSYVLVAALSAAVAFALPRNPGKLGQLETLITRQFVGEADREALLDAAAAAMVDATGDRWSYYMSAQEYALQKEQTANAFVGVGITILKEEGGFRILEVTPGSGAEAVGIVPQDLLTGVNGQDVTGLDTTGVRAQVLGKAGTTVDLTVLRGQETLTFPVERRNIQSQVASYEMLEGSIALIQIRNFNTRCAQETIAAMESALAEGAQSFLFDVRNNGGGYASELVEVLDYLLPEGELFRTRRYDGKEDVDMSDAAHVDIPMAVLVNSHSYSAAEFFAAALMEYDAATVVGEKTVGKGYYQVTYPLRDGSAVALSIGKYFTPKGVSLENVGITPDYEVPLTEEQYLALSAGTLPPQEDPQVRQAVQALENR